MIKRHCFERNWILEQREKLGGADPTLLEKSILAFELLAQLANAGLPFVFKGGTSLLLLLDTFHRLSIDVDIICDIEAESQREVFGKVIESSPFSRWVEDPRTPSGIPKKHYKFFYASRINRREDYVLLDVLSDANPYPAVHKKLLALPFIQTHKEIFVTVPSVDSIIGDKLTAFAPHTIGIPLDPRRSMQLVKQLFDLGELFPQAASPEEISSSYNAFVLVENQYRKTAFEPADTLRDTLETCYTIVQLDLRGSIENESTSILRRGIRQLESHLLDVSFGLTQAKIAASRVALLCALLLAQPPVELHKLFFSDDKVNEIRSTTITGKWSIINRLKGIVPESFYYWSLAHKYLMNI